MRETLGYVDVAIARPRRAYVTEVGLMSNQHRCHIMARPEIRFSSVGILIRLVSFIAFDERCASLPFLTRSSTQIRVMAIFAFVHDNCRSQTPVDGLIQIGLFDK